MSEKILKDRFELLPVVVETDLTGLTSDEVKDLLVSETLRKKKLSKNVLGKIEGPYFFPDGYSRNKRFYPRKLWEKVLNSKEVQDKLERGMLGYIEHPVSAPHPSMASHVTKKLWIGKDGLGYGTSYILNTPQGRILATLGGARDENGDPLVKLFVSSRAYGSYKGKDANGNYIMDPDTYRLEGFDVVLDPGFLEAFPEYKEILSEAFKAAEAEDYERMGCSALFASLENYMEVNDMDKLEALRKEYSERIKELEESLKKWETLGKYDDVVKALESAKLFFDENGKPNEIKEKLEKCRELKAKVEEFEKECGTLEEASKALKEYKEFFEKYGEPEKIKEALEKAHSKLREYAFESLSARFGISKEKVEELSEKVGSLSALEAVLEDLYPTKGLDDDLDAPKAKRNESRENDSDRPTGFGRFDVYSLAKRLCGS